MKTLMDLAHEIQRLVDEIREPLFDADLQRALPVSTRQFWKIEDLV